MVSEGGLEIRTLDTALEMAAIVNVFQMVWGSVTPIASVELLRAISHAGGYVAGAFESDTIVGASFGFLARHEGQQALHSHVTGIVPGIQHSGIGRAVKHHQRGWAAERGIPWITWTFDPLVRRNAWFNIEVLGARIADYHVNFYGEMTDSINASDESDRLLVAWATDDPAPRPRSGAATVTHELATPDDIVLLRRTDPLAAAEWRQSVRRKFTELLAAGGVVTAFTRSGSYIIETPR